MIRPCIICGELFKPKTTAITCSPGCANQQHRRRCKGRRDSHRAAQSVYHKRWREERVVERRAYLAEWYRANTEKQKAASKRRYEADKKAWNIATAKWRKANPQKASLSAIKWRKKNPEAYRAIAHARRAREHGAPGRHSGEEIKAMLLAQKFKCAACRSPIKSKYHKDHILPLVLGGANDIGNIQLLCVRCNLVKGKKHPEVWAHENGRLL